MTPLRVHVSLKNEVNRRLVVEEQTTDDGRDRDSDRGGFLVLAVKSVKILPFFQRYPIKWH